MQLHSVEGAHTSRPMVAKQEPAEEYFRKPRRGRVHRVIYVYTGSLQKKDMSCILAIIRFVNVSMNAGPAFRQGCAGTGMRLQPVPSVLLGCHLASAATA